MRTFIALKIEIKDELREFIGNLQLHLKEEKIKWVNPDNLHLTLFFLGETSQQQVTQIVSELGGIISQYPQINLKIRGLGVFRNLKDPRVIWIGIDKNPALEALFFQIRDLMVDHGFRKDDRPFKPHLTIGRIKRIYDKAGMSGIIEANRERFFQKMIIQEVIYYQSILKACGPEYHEIEKFRLGQFAPG